MSDSTSGMSEFRAKFYTGEGKVVSVPVTEIIFRKDFYPRNDTQDPSKIQEYATAIKGGIHFPPIVLTPDGHPLRGWHRWMAHREAGEEMIEATFKDVSKFVWQDGLDLWKIRRLAASDNCEHGIPQSDREIKKLIRDEYRAKWDHLDQAGREALKQEMAAEYHRGMRYVREATSRIDKDLKAELRETAFDMWLACATQQEIATEIGYSDRAVRDFLELLQNRENGADSVFPVLPESGDVGIPDDVREFEESAEEEEESNSLGVYELDPRRLIKARHLDEHYKAPIYNIWKQQERSGQVTHFGNTEITWLDHLLYLYTKPFDVVIDPFAGGGSTIDLCKQRLRRYLVSDLTPPEVRQDVRQHDITTGLLAPPVWGQVKLVYLDPPYWLQAAGQYGEEPTNLANMDLETFTKALAKLVKQYAEKIKRSRNEGAVISLVIQPTQWNAPDHQFTDHIADLLCAVDLPIDMRISVPYESQQHNPQQVQWAKENRRILVLTREIVVWKVA